MPLNETEKSCGSIQRRVALATVVATLECGSAFGGSALLFPFESVSNVEQYEPSPRQGDAMRAWEGVPVNVKADIVKRMIPLDNAQRIVLLDSVPATRSLSADQKQAIIDYLCRQ